MLPPGRVGSCMRPYPIHFVKSPFPKARGKKRGGLGPAGGQVVKEPEGKVTGGRRSRKGED